MASRKWTGARSRAARAICEPLVQAGVACWRCKKPILPGQKWDPDHIVDRAMGGGDEAGNLWPSHRRCNQSAGGRVGARVTNARRAERAAVAGGGRRAGAGATVRSSASSERDRGIRGV